MERECYCENVEPDQKPYMLICGECKKHFHAACLETGKLSPLDGDIFYHFKCRCCGDEGKEESDRMKMQWLQVVMLTLYNLQLSGNGKCGYFRWKEHICAFIDKHWSLLFAAHRKKTSLWHGTVAGTLSTGCPGYFTSGANVLGEAGWWKLTDMKPPMLKVESGLRPARKKHDQTSAIDPAAVIKVEGLRSRRGKSSIQAAMELKSKRSTLTEAKEIRKAKASSKTPESTPPRPSSSGTSSSTSHKTAASPAATSPLPDVETFGLFQHDNFHSKDNMKTKMSDTVKNTTASDVGSKRSKKSDCVVKQETVDPSYTSTEGKSVAMVTVKEEPPDSESSLASASFQSTFSWSIKAEADEDSQFSRSSSHMWFTDKDTKAPDTMPELFLNDDSDSDLEIDPGRMSPPTAMWSAGFRESPSVQDILSSIDDNSRLSEDSTLTHPGSKPAVISIKSETETPGKSDNEAELEGEEESEESDRDDSSFHKKRRLDGGEDEKPEEPPPPIYAPMSLYDEIQLLKKLNMVAERMTLEPQLNRFRRKLIVRQLKRERGMPVFDLDLEMKKITQQDFRQLQDMDDGFGPRSQMRSSMKPRGADLRILDRFQCNPMRSKASSQHFSSFMNRLVGVDDDQLQCITSPYTTRVLKPFIRRDHETKPLKMRLLEEIVAYPHSDDSSWQPPPSPPIDYCYVRPQHIPSVNTLCREFFWPGIDLSECLQYPDFSCVVLYRKVIIGFAFMVPDVKYNEAYISFIFVHPEWRGAGIASFMLYHLIQTCMGKDVTLHVSATNTAMMLYQKFGFKTEEFILDFYDKYYPIDTRECKHAFFLRLRR
ncbi:cysteine-rich protein 2-binding protein-like isoform X1 [Haliotis cracherodii]|uniref:cysteine-rich protein 2-binding protein-like isoform X1 n=1 Tax=Haliotis cracherodii TaxID=6455 RepID=UPI0039E76B08